MGTTIEGEALALEICRLADGKQAEEITVIDLRGISTITDYFVICTGTSLPHLKAIRKEVTDKLQQDHETRASSTDGDAESQWLVLDFGDVIGHVFNSEKRELYALEDLWSDAPRIAWEGVATPGE